MNHWDNRNQYHVLLENFVQGKINSVEFEENFADLWREDRDKSFLRSITLGNSEQAVQQNQAEAEKLEQVLSRVFTACDVFDPDPTTRTQYEYGEEELRQFVQNLLKENSDLFFKE